MFLLTNQPLQSIPSLQKLLQREPADQSQRMTTLLDVDTMTVVDAKMAGVDPWNIAFRAAARGGDGLRQCLQRLSLFAYSSVEIPPSVFLQCATATNKYRCSARESLPLVQAVLASTWARSLGRQGLIAVITSLHLRLGPDIVTSLSVGEQQEELYALLMSLPLMCLTDFLR